MVRGDESNGRTILERGVDQLVVVEACLRLIFPGGVGVDVGANYGQMTSALHHGSHPGGTVYAFEPHPVLFEYLRENTSAHQDVFARNKALSEKQGTASLHVPVDWERHAGTSSLENDFRRETEEVRVETSRFDEEVEEPIDVMKLDVEGHEESVLRGAPEHLEGGDIRHIVFEDHNFEESSAVSLMRERGYELYSVEQSLSGPTLVSPRPRADWNFIATLDPADCRERFDPMGWKVLQSD